MCTCCHGVAAQGIGGAILLGKNKNNHRRRTTNPLVGTCNTARGIAMIKRLRGGDEEEVARGARRTRWNDREARQSDQGTVPWELPRRTLGPRATNWQDRRQPPPVRERIPERHKHGAGALSLLARCVLLLVAARSAAFCARAVVDAASRPGSGFFPSSSSLRAGLRRTSLLEGLVVRRFVLQGLRPAPQLK